MILLVVITNLPHTNSSQNVFSNPNTMFSHTLSPLFAVVHTQHNLIAATKWKNSHVVHEHKHGKIQLLWLLSDQSGTLTKILMVLNQYSLSNWTNIANSTSKGFQLQNISMEKFSCSDCCQIKVVPWLRYLWSSIRTVSQIGPTLQILHQSDSSSRALITASQVLYQ
jgi:hypothetical protein